jgi:hypothetical protein
VNHQGLHRDGLVSAFEGVHIEAGLFPVFVFAVLAHFPAPSAFNLIKAARLRIASLQVNAAFGR